MDPVLESGMDARLARVQVRIACPRCLYDWTPRKASPKECPQCKRRLPDPERDARRQEAVGRARAERAIDAIRTAEEKAEIARRAEAERQAMADRLIEEERVRAEEYDRGERERIAKAKAYALERLQRDREEKRPAREEELKQIMVEVQAYEEKYWALLQGDDLKAFDRWNHETEEEARTRGARMKELRRLLAPITDEEISSSDFPSGDDRGPGDASSLVNAAN